ncbi:MAG: hypothetical protein RX318_08935 [bacterium]|nr:hypothetical protein [bacterium]
MPVKAGDVKSGVVSLFSAFAASLCCVLPLVVILLGLGSGAFMATTMKYRAILIPTGAGGLALGYFLYFRERRRCRTLACRMAGAKLNLALLIFATGVVAVAVFFDIFPVFASKLLMSALPN